MNIFMMGYDNVKHSQTDIKNSYRTWIHVETIKILFSGNAYDDTIILLIL